LKNQEYRYARVSGKDQNLKRQLLALADFSIPLKNIFADKKSGKDFELLKYNKLLKKVKPGDLLKCFHGIIRTISIIER